MYSIAYIRFLKMNKLKLINIIRINLVMYACFSGESYRSKFLKISVKKREIL